MGSWIHGFNDSISGKWDVDRFLGFMVSFIVLWFHGFMVSWLHALHLWAVRCWQASKFHGFDDSMSWEWDVDRFCGFMVSCTPFLDSEMLTRGLVSWFRELHLWTARCWRASEFHGFMVSMTPSLDSEMLTGFSVSRFCSTECTAHTYVCFLIFLTLIVFRACVWVSVCMCSVSVYMC